jgi:hypothetical protein
MKLSVAYDQDGNILAANWVVEGGDELEAGEGGTVAEFDPPEDMTRRLEAVASRISVRVTGARGRATIFLRRRWLDSISCV